MTGNKIDPPLYGLNAHILEAPVNLDYIVNIQ